MNLAFKSIEIDSRLIPVQMSIVAIGRPRVIPTVLPATTLKSPKAKSFSKA